METTVFPDVNGVIAALAIVLKLYLLKRASYKRGSWHNGYGNPLSGAVPLDRVL